MSITEHKSKTKLNSIEDAINDIRLGKVVVVVDDENRENEGDFIAAAEKVTPEMINFMALHGRGLICVTKIIFSSHLTSILMLCSMYNN